MLVHHGLPYSSLYSLHTFIVSCRSTHGSLVVLMIRPLGSGTGNQEHVYGMKTLMSYTDHILIHFIVFLLVTIIMSCVLSFILQRILLLLLHLTKLFVSGTYPVSLNSFLLPCTIYMYISDVAIMINYK